MKKAIILCAILGAISIPVFAQQVPVKTTKPSAAVAVSGQAAQPVSVPAVHKTKRKGVAVMASSTQQQASVKGLTAGKPSKK